MVLFVLYLYQGQVARQELVIKPLSMRNTLQSSYLSLGDEAVF